MDYIGRTPADVGNVILHGHHLRMYFYYEIHSPLMIFISYIYVDVKFHVRKFSVYMGV